MNRPVVFGVLGVVAFMAHGACQGPDSFYRLDTGAGGAAGGSGLGGHGLGGSGLGGSGLGGRLGAGGSFGLGGTSGFGGAIAASGGRTGGTGGITGAGGRMGTGGTTGVGGMSGPGDGGAGTDASTGCVATLQSNGYMSGTHSCDDCTEQSNFPMKCRDTVDCMHTPACTGNCFQECYNKFGGSGTLRSCLVVLLSAAGCPP
jgi:hypothetical protein